MPIFVKLLESKSDEVKEQAVWALGNMVGDGPEIRDLVLSHGAMPKMLQILNSQTNAQLVPLSLLRYVKHFCCIFVF